MKPERKGSMLVVDDQPNSIAVTTQILKTLGYNDIDCANSVEQARKQILTKRYDGVFCDWHMPEQNGIELLRALGNEDQRIRPRFFFLSIDKNWGRLADARTNGADGYIIKCNRPMLLREKIAKAIQDAA